MRSEEEIRKKMEELRRRLDDLLKKDIPQDPDLQVSYFSALSGVRNALDVLEWVLGRTKGMSDYHRSGWHVEFDVIVDSEKEDAPPIKKGTLSFHIAQLLERIGIAWQGEHAYYLSPCNIKVRPKPVEEIEESVRMERISRALRKKEVKV